MQFYWHRVTYVRTDLVKNVTLMGGTWRQKNHYSLLQLQVISGMLSLNFREALYNHIFIVIPRSRCASTVSSSPMRC